MMIDDVSIEVRWISVIWASIGIQRIDMGRISIEVCRNQRVKAGLTRLTVYPRHC